MLELRTLLVPLVFCILAAGPADTLQAQNRQPEPVEQARVMSFNMWQGGDSWSLCVDAMRRSNADIIGLQEATDFVNIAIELGYYYDEGTWTLSRWPITDVQGWGYGQAVTITTPSGQEIHVFNCHLPAYPYGPYELPDVQKALQAENQTQWPALQPILQNMTPYIATGDPCFFTGDFNVPSHLDYTGVPWKCSQECAAAGLTDSYRTVHPGNRTYPPFFAFDEPGITWTPKPDQEPYDIFDRIDFVYCCGDQVTAVRSDAHDSLVAPWPSDHRAVVSLITIPKGNSPQPKPNVWTGKSTYVPGEDITVHFDNTPANLTDWIGLYDAGAPFGPGHPSIMWEYTNGAISGSITFPGGLTTEGDYDARLFWKDRYVLLAEFPFKVSSGKGKVDDPIRAFLVAGQSNTDGYGLGYGNLSYGYLDPPDDLDDIGRSDLVAPQAQVGIFHGAYYSGNGSWQTLEPGFGIQWNGIRFGPELSLGYDVQAQCGLDVRLIKYSVGGTSLAYDWDPDATGTNQYDYFMTTVQNAIAAAGSAGETLDIIGLAWMQGESDALNYSMATAYQANLTHFIASVRQDLGLPDLEVYVASIADSSVWTYRQIIWDAQENVAWGDPRVNVVNGKDLPLFINDGDGSAYIHYTTQGEVTLGERFAGSVLSSLAVSPDPLVAGQNGVFDLIRGRPNRNAFLIYSFAGPGSTWLPKLLVSIGLANPRLSRFGTADAQGRTDWSVPIPPAAAGFSVWIQVAQYEQISNVVATTIL